MNDGRKKTPKEIAYIENLKHQIRSIIRKDKLNISKLASNSKFSVKYFFFSTIRVDPININRFSLTALIDIADLLGCDIVLVQNREPKSEPLTPEAVEKYEAIKEHKRLMRSLEIHKGLKPKTILKRETRRDVYSRRKQQQNLEKKENDFLSLPDEGDGDS